MTRPARLRYTDSNSNDVIIGVLNTDETQSDIDGLQLKNSGSGEYTRIEVTGDSNLLDRMPVNKNEFENANEPEIFLDVWSTSIDDWVVRDRVFAEKKGAIETDKGDYRNDQLYGFQKWVGRQKVNNLGPINSDVAGIISAALSNVPGNYTVQTAGTIPSVQNYTYTGRIDSLIRDVIRDYPNITIYWTADEDSGDTVVRVEEAGAGSTVETITFPDPNYQLINYEPEDTTNVVNRVIVKGTDSNNNSVEVDTDNFTSGSLATDISNSKDKYGETTIERNIGYLQDTSHAQEIAKNLLELEAKPHLEVSLPFQEGNALNASVDITDDRYGIDGVYKVVKQRDFFKDSRTEVELSFEKNASEKRRAKDRDVGEERASLFPEIQTDVGGQDAGDLENDSSQADNNTQEDDKSPDTSGSTGNDFGDSNYSFVETGASLSDGGSLTAQLTAIDFASRDTQHFLATVNFSFNGTAGDVNVVIRNATSGSGYFNETFSLVQGNTSRTATIIQQENIDGDTIEAEVTNNSGDFAEISVDLTVDQIEQHQHLTSGSTDSHNHAVIVTDNGHGAPTDPSTHVISGTTAEKLLNLLNEDKTDR